jgi:hypothetical protein
MQKEPQKRKNNSLITNMNNKKLPVLFLIFRRKDVALKALESIRDYKPEQLYIAADGPRIEREGEAELCEQTRKAVLEAIDWDCEIKTLFRTENLGCANAIYEAISWFFETEEFGVIIEDDVVIHRDFYRLCEQLLPQYENEKQIMLISAYNPTPDMQRPNQLIFSNQGYIWGWATWQRAWAKMDMAMSKWPQYSIFLLIKEFGLFQGIFYLHYWSSTYKNISTLNSWAIRWDFAITSNNGLCLYSNANLSKNIGIGIENGTHYSKNDTDIFMHLPLGGIQFPVKLPDDIKANRKKVMADRKEFFRIRMHGLKKKLKQFLK